MTLQTDPAMTDHSTERAVGRDREADAPAAQRPGRILVFDSGLGGLTVLGEITKALPGREVVFAADDAVFPYGGLSEPVLLERVMRVIEALVARFQPGVVVIACNTASTAVLPPLRARWPDLLFVGTVPAIKPAAALSRSKLISVLATPGTVARDYTRDLVQRFAGDCTVALVGAPRLAGYVEAVMRGEIVDDAAIAAEIAPAFVRSGSERTDAVVLACTHFPLLLDRLVALAPWPVTWIDSAPAIARRVGQVLEARDGPLSIEGPGTARASIPAIFTSGRAPGKALGAFLASRGVVSQPGAPF